MITLSALTDFTTDERARLQLACDLVNKCLGDEGFIAKLRSSTFYNTDFSNDQIVSDLTAPITITRLFCEDLGWWATHWSKTVAKEAPDGSVTFNRAFFDRQTIASLANTLLHEACHVAGYSHRSPTDYLSVPYQAGDECEAYAEEMGWGEESA